MNRPPSIEFRNVTFGPLENLSLIIPSGAFAAVVGPTGAGKSALLGLIAGTSVPREGSVVIDGNPADIVLIDEGKAPSRTPPRQTIVMADYRLEPVRNADVIFVLENGSIVERGTHRALMKAGGAYAIDNYEVIDNFLRLQFPFPVLVESTSATGGERRWRWMVGVGVERLSSITDR